MMKKLFFTFLCSIIAIVVSAQTYNEHDKDALRKFFRQPSNKSGKLNLEMVGLTINDTINWSTSEDWITKITGITWSASLPKQIEDIPNLWGSKSLAGNLDFSNCTGLKRIYLNSNKITAIDFSNCNKLVTFSCDFNNISILKLSGCISLDNFFCNSNKLQEIDVSSCNKVQSINAGMNLFSTINVSNCPELSKLTLEGGAVTSLNLEQNPKLVTLYLGNNQLTSIDLTKNPLLEDFRCNKNKLTNLDLSNKPNLKKVLAHTNKLESLNLSGSISTPLEQFTCHENNLKFSALTFGAANQDIYTYAPQNAIQGGQIASTKTIDLSSEYLIEGKVTVFNWFDVTSGSETPITLTGNNGIFNLTANMVGKKLVCKMTNASYPDFNENPLNYAVEIIQGNTAQESITISSGFHTIAYPNPAIKGRAVNLNLPDGADRADINIYNISGKFIKQYCQVENSFTAPEETGNYVLRIKLPDGSTLTEKLQVK